MSVAPEPSPSGSERLIAAVLVVAFALAACIARWPAIDGNYVHPDERIAESVVGRVLAEGTLDTNWARSGVSEDFRHNQYNFSSYYLTAAAVELAAGHRAADADTSVLRRHLRHLSCLLGGVVIFLSGLLGWRLAATAEAAAVAALLTAANVTLFQDAIYARPEAFFTAASLLYMLLMTSRRLSPASMLAMTALLGGFLLAAKVSFALFLPFPLLIVAARMLRERSPRPIDLRWLSVGFVVFAFGVALGFCIGAPHAVLAPHEYVEGIRSLLRQYAEGFGPHGLPHGDLLARFGYGIAYLCYTQGPLLPALVVFGYANLLWRRRVVPALALLGPLLTIAYFLQTHAFFERNFSHALPAAFALAGCAVSGLARVLARRIATGRAPSGRTALAATTGVMAGLILALPSLSVSRKLSDLASGAIDYPRLIDAEQQRVTSQGKLELVAIGYGDSIIAQRRYLLCQERIYRVLDYGDPGTRANVQMALAQGFRQVGSVLSPFHGSPTSTLWVYHAADIEFLAAPESDSTACIADAGPLRDDPSFAAVEAPVAMDGSWASGAFPPDMKTFGWRFPLFASWSGGDVGTGRITIGPFATCGRVVVPFATGPETAHTRLRIERVVDAGSQTLFDGVPPRVPGWRAIRMPGDETCASYLVEARDDGTGWGEWIGVGVPARQVAPPPAGDDAPAQ